jgi:hypothetical protein
VCRREEEEEEEPGQGKAKGEAEFSVLQYTLKKGTVLHSTTYLPTYLPYLTTARASTCQRWDATRPGGAKSQAFFLPFFLSG